MSTLKQSRRKSGTEKLEPIDWHEYANDAVLNGNMSTLYHRPPSEDPTAYASPEALLEIEKRASRPEARPTVGGGATVGPTDARDDEGGSSDLDSRGPAAGRAPAMGAEGLSDLNLAAALPMGGGPTVGTSRSKAKPIRDVQDALTLAGKVLYQAMYGPPDGAISKSCTKGYRQLAAETHLDKDTVRDLIGEFKAKGIVRETGTYNSDTRSAKTYEVFSYAAVLQMWREAGIVFVTSGRSRPMFCTAQADPLRFVLAVGRGPTVVSAHSVRGTVPTVGQ